jgi:DNA-binding transcriptional ArsR family regulator
MLLNSDIAPVAALLADPSRAAMMTTLLDGRALPAGELARIAGVSPQTASAHLAKLLDAGLVKLAMQGRHRYYAIASAEIAHAIETLSSIAPAPTIRSLRQSLEMKRLSAARTCYDHLAGNLSVRIADALVERGDFQRLDGGFAVTPAGVTFFSTLRIDAAALCKTTPPFSRSCIDWTERRQHLAGPLGKALLASMLDRNWIERSGEPRSVRLTPLGMELMRSYFGVEA